MTTNIQWAMKILSLHAEMANYRNFINKFTTIFVTFQHIPLSAE